MREEMSRAYDELRSKTARREAELMAALSTAEVQAGMAQQQLGSQLAPNTPLTSRSAFYTPGGPATPGGAPDSATTPGPLERDLRQHELVQAQLASGRATPNSISAATEPYGRAGASSPTPSVSSVWSAASDMMGERSLTMSGVWARRHRARAEEKQRSQALQLQ